MSESRTPQATYDAATPAIHITSMQAVHPAVTSEALRWSTGVRGPAVGAGAMDGADLTAYIEQALAVGAQAISVAGGTQDIYNLEQLVQDVGSRTTESTRIAAENTGKVVTEATKAMQDASIEARKALTDAGEAARTAFGASVSTANKELREQLTRMLGGEDPELVGKLQLVVNDFGSRLTKQADEHTTALFDKATRALNPDDPASPLAKHMVKLDAQHTALTTTVEKQHLALAGKVEELATAVKVQKAATAASLATATVTPLKGFSYEENVAVVMRDIAAGLGDEYTESGATVGLVARSRKGDGVLRLHGGGARVVLEMTDSPRKDWGDYLDEAERNRGASAALGLVPNVERNNGQMLRVIGARRIVMAFDPLKDDPSLLRTVIILLRAAATAAATRMDGEGVQTANERIAEAIAVLPQIDSIRKLAGGIRKNADKVDTEADKLHTTLSRLLLQAQTALELVDSAELGEAAASANGQSHGAA